MGPTLVVFARGSGPDGPRLRGRAGRPAGRGRGLERFPFDGTHSRCFRSRQRTRRSAPARARRTTGGPRSRPGAIPANQEPLSLFSLAAADLTVRACAGAPDDRRAAVAAWSDSHSMGPTLVVFARGSEPDGPRLRGRAGRPAGRGRGLERFLPILKRSRSHHHRRSAPERKGSLTLVLESWGKFGSARRHRGRALKDRSQPLGNSTSCWRRGTASCRTSASRGCGSLG